MSLSYFPPIKIYNQIPHGSEHWTWTESQNSNNSVNTLVAYNVVEPTLTPYLPASQKDPTPAIIVCPGGGFHFLAIDHEGSSIANWFAKQGIAAFVLKYRTAPVTTDNPFDALNETRSNEEWDNDAMPYIPHTINDGRQAIRYLKAHVEDYNLDARSIGIMGFSAGAMVAVGTTFHFDPDTRPRYAASIYGDLRKEFLGDVSHDTPPLFLMCAQDDEYGFVPHTLHVYQKWYAAKRPVEMHLLGKGGHGFGIGNPHDSSFNWLEHFLLWMKSVGLREEKK